MEDRIPFHTALLLGVATWPCALGWKVSMPHLLSAEARARRHPRAVARGFSKAPQQLDLAMLDLRRRVRAVSASLTVHKQHSDVRYAVSS